MAVNIIGDKEIEIIPSIKSKALRINLNDNIYGSFSEIDRQLKILSLQREIDLESFKLNLNRCKTDLYPTQLLGGFKGVFQKTLISLIINKIMKKRKARQLEQ